MLERILRRTLLGGIHLYQRGISPYKGYGCPHRLLHGGISCSGYAVNLLEGGAPLASAAGLMRERFGACRDAAAEIQATRCVIIPCCC